MATVPNVFFSYSRTNVAKRKLIDQLIRVAKEAVESIGWHVLDPLAAKGRGGVRRKVLDSLIQADLVIADVSSSTPNVMFEVGFAQAREVPILFLVNLTELPEPGADVLKAYFASLPTDGGRPLPADLGDVEYLTYNKDLHFLDEKNCFRGELDALLKNLAESELASGSLSLRRMRYRLSFEIGGLTSRFAPNHPVLHYLVSRCENLLEEAEAGGKTTYLLDARNYSSCLPAFGNWAEEGALAIADLTDPTERFWHTNPNPKSTKVTERIFLIDSTTFFENEKFSEIAEILRRQAEEYDVYICDTAAMDKLNLPGRVPGAVGRNFVLMAPDLVAVYTEEKEHLQVRFEVSKDQYKEVEHVYRSLRNVSVACSHDTKTPDLRSEWMHKREIGKWDRDWGIVDSRTERYFDDYEAHIRAWIPHYADLVSRCSALVMQQVIELIRQTQGKIRILEVGYGTGSLTKSLLARLDGFNLPYRDAGEQAPIEEFVGVDYSDRMREALMERLNNRSQLNIECNFLVEDFWDYVNGGSRAGEFDLICGSLVLHDLVGGQGETAVTESLRTVRHVLKEKGALVFADVFMPVKGTGAHDPQLRYWQKQMLRYGMRQDDIDLFFKHNKDMTETVTEQQLRAIANKEGFSQPQFHYSSPAAKKLPFRTLVLRRGLSSEQDFSI